MENRPNPNSLLKRIHQEDGSLKKGKLKIFFGYAAGVGKTYAMLDAAHNALKAGLDVVVGYVEPHTRPETLALLEGLEVLSPLKVQYKSIVLNEFDLDAALQRRPQIVLVDELAHTNAEGLRHIKRYSDVEELLDAGIDVYTTVNVQHLESLNDIVASITHVVVKERIPDRIFDNASQVELIDIEPSDLEQRLNAGKIYREKQAQKALSNFFTRENLAALREIALRRTADRVNKEVETNKSAGNGGYHTNEHILVCLSSSPSNAKVIRTAARMADSFHASFTALFVETPNTRELNDGNRKRLRENLKLAEELGATIATTYGEDAPYQIAEYAKVSGVSKIIIGRPNRKLRLLGTRMGFVDKLIDMAPDLDIYVIPDRNTPSYHPKNQKLLDQFHLSWTDTIKTLVIMTLCTLLGLALTYIGFTESNIIILFLLGVLIIANQTRGSIYGAISSLMGVLLFNFFFTVPKFTFEAYRGDYPVIFAVMLVGALITSTLTTRVKRQAESSAVTAYRTNILLETNNILQRADSLSDIILKSQIQVYKLVKKPIVFYSVRNGEIGRLYTYQDDQDSPFNPENICADEQGVVNWVIRNKKKAGAFTDTLPGARASYTPLVSKDRVMGVLGIITDDRKDLENPERSLLVAVLNQITFAIEKYQLSEKQKETQLQAENERFRANLLRAVSHDLRTPLTSISGSANSLLSNKFDAETKTQLIEGIYDDSLWLINLVENLLSVSRIDNGHVSLKTQPQLIEEIVGEALQHVSRKAAEHQIHVNLQDDLLMADVDVRLIVQVFINIIDNAVKYTQSGSDITISARALGQKVVIEIADNGEGISDRNKECIFDMFFTAEGNRGDSRRGLGLGLALCKSIVNAHGGDIYVKDNQPAGTIFGFTLKLVKVDENNGSIRFSS